MAFEFISESQGVVQGSPASPAIAQCVLVSLEVTNHRIFSAEGGMWQDFALRRFRATVCRWVDDVQAWVQVFWSNESEKLELEEFAEKYLESVFAVYTSVFDLKVEQCENFVGHSWHVDRNHELQYTPKFDKYFQCGLAARKPSDHLGVLIGQLVSVADRSSEGAVKNGYVQLGYKLQRSLFSKADLEKSIHRLSLRHPYLRDLFSNVFRGFEGDTQEGTGDRDVEPPSQTLTITEGLAESIRQQQGQQRREQQPQRRQQQQRRQPRQQQRQQHRPQLRPRPKQKLKPGQPSARPAVRPPKPRSRPKQTTTGDEKEDKTMQDTNPQRRVTRLYSKQLAEQQALAQQRPAVRPPKPKSRPTTTTATTTTTTLTTTMLTPNPYRRVTRLLARQLAEQGGFPSEGTPAVRPPKPRQQLKTTAPSEENNNNKEETPNSERRSATEEDHKEHTDHNDHNEHTSHNEHNNHNDHTERGEQQGQGVQPPEGEHSRTRPHKRGEQQGQEAQPHPTKHDHNRPQTAATDHNRPQRPQRTRQAQQPQRPQRPKPTSRRKRT